jgi:N-methylhydantoinase A/oxoprolinase/acetone carboxylase beta subunit
MIKNGKRFLIGIDTGGTYTDAAVISEQDHRVVASAKALTTKGDLVIGVSEAMRKACAKLPHGFNPATISLVSVSTTLATNAVVEGHGSQVCVVLIGFDGSMAARSGITQAFPGMPVVIIGGGHDHNGEEKVPLEEAQLTAAIKEHGGRVEAFAVAAQFAVRNPGHEQRARDIIIAETGKPVTMSSELSSALDAPRRALTAALNARLISRIAILIEAVRSAMKDLGLNCPLMIVKGDGTLALAEAVAKRPIETVLSGPAASLVGARWLSGLDSFIMSDMGGTTTDLGILIGGRPKVTEQGAEVGGWRTMVRAIDVTTVGLGGDSEISITADGRLSVGPQRIVPVSLIGAMYPEVIASLAAELAEPEISSLTGRFIMRPWGWKNGDIAAGELSKRESDILCAVDIRPRPLHKVAASAGAQRAVNGLRRKGLVQIAGFTPSDAAHVLDMQSNWSREAALLAAQLMTRLKDMKAPTAQRVLNFAEDAWSEVVRLSGRAILDAAVDASGRVKIGGDELLDAVAGGKEVIGLARVAISPTVPIVAVGAPVKVYYREVGERLGAEIVFPDHCEVANAVGAATGVVARTVSVQVTADGGGLFRVHAPEGTQVFAGAKAALEMAVEGARQAAAQAVIAMGATDAELRLTVEKHMLPDAMDENGLFAAVVTAEAIGRPHIGNSLPPRGAAPSSFSAARPFPGNWKWPAT